MTPVPAGHCPCPGGTFGGASGIVKAAHRIRGPHGAGISGSALHKDTVVGIHRQPGRPEEFNLAVGVAFDLGGGDFGGRPVRA